jgi:DNA replication protein DnaC
MLPLRSIVRAPAGAQAVTMPQEAPICAIQAGRSARSPESTQSMEQRICNVCAGAGWYVLAVPYGHAQFAQLQRCDCAAYHAQIADRGARLQDELGSLADKTFDRFDLARQLQPAKWQGNTIEVATQRGFMRDAHRRCSSWALQPRGWLFIHGAFGAGKSHLAAAIANAQQAAGKVVRFVTVNKLLDTLRSGIDNGTTDRMIADLIACDLLILDELSAAQLAESASDWRFGRIERLINERLTKPTVITSNLAPDDLAQPGDMRAERIADRIAGAAQIVWMPLASYRRLQQQATL